MASFIQQCHALMNAAQAVSRTYSPEEILPLLDHTCLQRENAVDALHKCWPKVGKVAAICVYPEQLNLVRKHAPQAKTATVINFPHGNDARMAIDQCLATVIQAQVDEIDVVFPYMEFLAGKTEAAFNTIAHVRQSIPDAVRLKVILETGQYPDLMAIQTASLGCLDAGANFLKTSTGMTQPGATLPAVAAILLSLQQFTVTNQTVVGCKISGGISSMQDLTPYLNLAHLHFGSAGLNPAQFRIGSSKLLDILFASNR